MRIKWIILVTISIIMIGCLTPVRTEKTYIRVNQQKTGPVDVFGSFDEVGTSYKKLAELKINNQRPPNKNIRDKMIQSLKTKARKLGADGIVIVEEGKSIDTIPDPLGGGGTIDLYFIFIKCTAIVYG